MATSTKRRAPRPPVTDEDTDAPRGKDVIYQMITDRFITGLELGRVPWRKTWADSFPFSASTGKPSYRGVNTLILPMVAAEKGYVSKWWLTFKQVAKLGGKVKGHINPETGRYVLDEEHTEVIWWSLIPKTVDDPDKPGSKKRVTLPQLRYYRVYNGDQTTGLPARYYEGHGTDDIGEIPELGTVLGDYLAGDPGLELRHVDINQPYYSESENLINMPYGSQFGTPVEYWHAMAHEAVHSAVNHKSRLNLRDKGAEDHSPQGKYALGELVAEIGACMLMSACGMEFDFLNSQAYVNGWITALKNDPKMIITAAATAQRAVDYIIGIRYTTDEGE